MLAALASRVGTMVSPLLVSSLQTRSGRVHHVHKPRCGTTIKLYRHRPPRHGQSTAEPSNPRLSAPSTEQLLAFYIDPPVLQPPIYHLGPEGIHALHVGDLGEDTFG